MTRPTPMAMPSSTQARLSIYEPSPTRYQRNMRRICPPTTKKCLSQCTLHKQSLTAVTILLTITTKLNTFTTCPSHADQASNSTTVLHIHLKKFQVPIPLSCLLLLFDLVLSPLVPHRRRHLHLPHPHLLTSLGGHCLRPWQRLPKLSSRKPRHLIPAKPLRHWRIRRLANAEVLFVRSKDSRHTRFANFVPA